MPELLRWDAGTEWDEAGVLWDQESDRAVLEGIRWDSGRLWDSGLKWDAFRGGRARPSRLATRLAGELGAGARFSTTLVDGMGRGARFATILPGALAQGSRFATRVAGTLAGPARFATTLHGEQDRGARFRTSDADAVGAGARFSTGLQLGQAAAASMSTGLPYGDTITLGGPYGLQVINAEIIMVLKAPDGSTHPLQSLKIGEALNKGWDWECTLPEHVGIDGPDENVYTIIVEAGGAVLESPPLVALDPEISASVSEGEGTTLAGIDRTMYRLSRDAHSFPIFRNSSTSAILGAIASAAQVSFLNAGGVTFPVGEEEIKNQKAVDPVARVALAAAHYFRIDKAGNVVFLPIFYDAQAPERPFGFTALKRRKAKARLVTEVVFQKSSRLQGKITVPFDSPGYKKGAFPNPLQPGVFATDISTSGFIDLIGIWEGSPDAGGKLGQFIVLGTFLGGSITTTSVVMGITQATHYTLTVGVPMGYAGGVAAKVLFMGTPADGITVPVDREFTYTHQTGISPARPRGSPWRDSLWPTRSHVIARADQLTWHLNKGYHTMALQGPLFLPFTVGQSLVLPNPWVDVRIERWSHTISPEAVETTLEAHAKTW